MGGCCHCSSDESIVVRGIDVEATVKLWADCGQNDTCESFFSGRAMIWPGDDVEGVSSLRARKMSTHVGLPRISFVHGFFESRGSTTPMYPRVSTKFLATTNPYNIRPAYPRQQRKPMIMSLYLPVSLDQ